MIIILSALLGAAAAPSTPYGATDYAAWTSALDARCPSHRIAEWMSPGVEVDLLDTYVATLSKERRRMFQRIANVPKVCNAFFRFGQSCDVNVKRHGVRKLMLLGQFADFACSKAVCTEASDCDPPRHPKHRN